MKTVYIKVAVEVDDNVDPEEVLDELDSALDVATECGYVPLATGGYGVRLMDKVALVYVDREQ